MSITVRQATPQDLEPVAVLFDQYRQFYGQPADLALARTFMSDRLAEGSSLVLIATDQADKTLGFTQLYPMFDSVGATRSFVLYDLFVSPTARRQGVARTLMEHAVATARELGAGRVELQTAKDNLPAQRLYEGLGWVRDNDFYVYAIAP
ncbi:GNAT family N-acetyltransferase [Stenotrophomonas sp. SY1]|uniref:GNAT family N-acetyltransferase n=1 Tax=Stenotrophomonas sp. SY1 TaxID=477235 RepID=UPI001E458B7B|nr:GNAT family N-acetyltransferase [Stenotrophomonas sp. SY1]MCD9086629.1 GNAT family N-acetyltransferase [Stenotrophomonas sp. SY1]